MADREFVFGRADVQQLLKKHFVVAAADDWYQRRREDPVGDYFRKVADQSPRKGKGGSTRQGRYTFTATGTLLGYNNNRDPQRILAMLRESLEKWNALPEKERLPDSVRIPPLRANSIDKRYARSLPEDALVVKVHSRVLERDDQGQLVPCGTPGAETDTFRHRGFGSATDHLWIRRDEIAALRKAVADSNPAPVPIPLAMRLARFHLVENTRGEPPHWKRPEVRALTLTASRDKKTPGRLQLLGSFHLETASGKRGYEGTLRGLIDLEADGPGIQRLDVVAIGEHWGEGTYTRGARPGKTPFGVAFTLGDRSNPKDLVPPQAIRWEQGYWEADRH